MSDRQYVVVWSSVDSLESNLNELYDRGYFIIQILCNLEILKYGIVAAKVKK